MTAIRPERAPATRLAGNGSGEATSPTDGTTFEGEIREFIRRDVAPLRRSRGEPDPAGDPAADHVNKLIGRVSGAAMEEIDRVILELQGVREMLRTEGERVTREISGFASLNHAAITSMKVIADSLAQWKNGAQIRPPSR
jgi:hypothetical protein